MHGASCLLSPQASHPQRPHTHTVQFLTSLFNIDTKGNKGVHINEGKNAPNAVCLNFFPSLDASFVPNITPPLLRHGQSIHKCHMHAQLIIPPIALYHRQKVQDPIFLFFLFDGASPTPSIVSPLFVMLMPFATATDTQYVVSPMLAVFSSSSPSYCRSFTIDGQNVQSWEGKKGGWGSL